MWKWYSKYNNIMSNGTDGGIDNKIKNIVLLYLNYDFQIY